MACVDCDHDHSPNKDSKIGRFNEDCDHDRNSLYISNLHFQSSLFFFEAITAEHLRLSSLRSASALDTWAHLIGLKKKAAIAN